MRQWALTSGQLGERMLKPSLILSYIKRHPGITPTKLETASGQNVSNHLTKLRQLRKIDCRRVKQGKYWDHRYYVAGISGQMHHMEGIKEAG